MDDQNPVPRTVAEAFFEAYAARDSERVAAFLHDDVEWTVNGPIDILPYCGTHRGKANVVDLIACKIPSVRRVFSFIPESFLVDGNRVAMLCRLSARHASDGRVISYRVANFFRFRDGKVIENVTLLDSYDVVEQLLGHPLAARDEDAGNAMGNLVAV